jgi:hypothetical protein
MKGNEAKPYAICPGSLESKASPKPKYIASITQMIPIRTYCKYDGGFTAMFRRKPKKIEEAEAKIIDQSRSAPTLS